MKRITLLFVSLILTTNIYANPGDIQGRDLDIWYIGAVGHVGLEQYENKIYEMIINKRKKSPWGYKNSHLLNSTIRSFKKYGGYWGARYWNGFENSSNSWRLHSYILPNAKLMYDIGADYTFTTNYKFSDGKIIRDKDTGKITKKIPLPGRFRCDTYIKSMYKTGGVNIDGLTIPYVVYNNMPKKR